jgi:hypothetical protein
MKKVLFVLETAMVDFRSPHAAAVCLGYLVISVPVVAEQHPQYPSSCSGISSSVAL